MKFAFIDAHRPQFSVRRMCQVLRVSPSGYYAWRKRPPSAREQADHALSERIEAIYHESGGTYGSPRIHAELAAKEVPCGQKRVARLMRQKGLKSVCKQAKGPRTTDSRHGQPIAPNRLDQDFSASAPNQCWLTDITYIPTGEGWLYLAVVLDLASRRIVGWAMSDSLHRRLVIDALQMATAARRPQPGLLHHSDRGSQYASDDYQALLERHEMLCSMSRRGNCYDNAPVESFFGSLKTERVYHRHYRTRAEARSDLFDYIEIFYNRFRRHSALGYLSPVEYEQLTFVA